MLHTCHTMRMGRKSAPFLSLYLSFSLSLSLSLSLASLGSPIGFPRRNCLPPQLLLASPPPPLRASAGRNGSLHPSPIGRKIPWCTLATRAACPDASRGQMGLNFSARPFGGHHICGDSCPPTTLAVVPYIHGQIALFPQPEKNIWDPELVGQLVCPRYSGEVKTKSCVSMSCQKQTSASR